MRGELLHQCVREFVHEEDVALGVGSHTQRIKRFRNRLRVNETSVGEEWHLRRSTARSRWSRANMRHSDEPSDTLTAHIWCSLAQPNCLVNSVNANDPSTPRAKYLCSNKSKHVPLGCMRKQTLTNATQLPHFLFICRR